MGGHIGYNCRKCIFRVFRGLGNGDGQTHVELDTIVDNIFSEYSGGWGWVYTLDTIVKNIFSDYPGGWGWVGAGISRLCLLLFSSSYLVTKISFLNSLAISEDKVPNMGT